MAEIGEQNGHSPDGGSEPEPQRSMSHRVGTTARWLASVLAERMRWITGVDGATFGGKRRLQTTLGYKEELLSEDYRWRYERGGIAKRIVEFMPKIAWPAKGPEVFDDPDESIETAFEEAIKKLAERLGLWRTLRRADVLCGIGRYSVVIIGTADGALNQPLPGRLQADSVLYLTPLDETRAKVVRLVGDDAAKLEEEKSDPRFGLPAEYEVKLSDARGAVKVHPSRVIHMADGLLDNVVFGTPRLKPVWNYLDDIDKIVGGGAEAAWLRANPGIHANLGSEYPMGEPELEKIKEQVDNYAHGLQRQIFTRNTDLTMLQGSVSAFGGNADAVVGFVCGTLGFPQRILMGSERGDMASTQDRANLADRATEHRDEVCEPAIRQFVDALVAAKAIPAPKDGRYEISWPDMDELTPGEQVAMAKEAALANQAQVAAGEPPIYLTDEIRGSMAGLDPLGANEVGGGGTDNPADPANVPPPPANENAPAATPAAARARPMEVDHPDWRAVHRAADEARSAVKTATRRMWELAAHGLSHAGLHGHVASGNQHGATQAAISALSDAEDAYMPELESALRRALEAGAHATLRSARSRGSWYARKRSRAAAASSAVETRGLLTFKFNAINPRAVAWARTRAAQMVTQIGESTREGIAQAVSMAFVEGIPPARLASYLQQFVGLRSDQIERIQRAVDAGATRGAVEKLADRELRTRAELIARTETMRAANAGQKELWLQARDAGQIPDRIQRAWITVLDGKERETHHELNDQLSPLDSDGWETSEGDVIEPGDEPNCRCSQGLVEGSGDASVELEAARGRSMSDVQRLIPGRLPHAIAYTPELRQPPARPLIGFATLYSPDQPRDDHGRFGEGDGGGAPAGSLDAPSSAYAPMNPEGRDTEARFSDGNGNYTPERAALHEAIIDKYLGGTTAVDNPTAMVLGGGPASGKSTLIEAENLSAPNTVQVNADLIREDLPEFKPGPNGERENSAAYSHEEASYIAKELTARALDGSRNVTLDGTGDSSIDRLGAKVDAMRAAGHDVVGEYVTVPTEMAWQRAESRGRETGRYVPETYLRFTHSAVSRTFSDAVNRGLFDRARLWDNRGSRPTLVYSYNGGRGTVHDQALWDEFISKGLQ